MINKYGLENLNQQLCNRHSENDSLRDLAEFVNKRILTAATDRADAYLVLEIDSIYDLLTGADISAGRQTDMEMKLKNEGVDIDTGKDDFVSHQTVKKHLNEELGQDTSKQTDFGQSDARSRIEWSKSRHTAVVENTLSQLQAANDISDNDFMVISSIQVSCKEYGRTYHVHEFIENCGCGCLE